MREAKKSATIEEPFPLERVVLVTVLVCEYKEKAKTSSGKHDFLQLEGRC